MNQNDYSSPDYWINFVKGKIDRHGPDSQQPSYRNPGQALELLMRWRALRESPEDINAIEALHDELYSVWQMQDCPVHSMWNEFLRGYERWAKLKPKV